MLDVHSDSASSNITKLFTRTSNIHTYNTRSSTSQLSSVKYSRLKMQKRKLFCVLVSKSGKRCPMNTLNTIQKFVKEILQKRSKNSSSQYSRNWRFLYGAWWDNAKFKHSKIESNWSSSTIFFVHLKTLGLFLLYNEHLPFCFFYFFAYLFVLLCYISSFPFYFQCN